MRPWVGGTSRRPDTPAAQEAWTSFITEEAALAAAQAECEGQQITIRQEDDGRFYASCALIGVVFPNTYDLLRQIEDAIFYPDQWQPFGPG